MIRKKSWEPALTARLHSVGKLGLRAEGVRRGGIILYNFYYTLIIQIYEISQITMMID